MESFHRADWLSLSQSVASTLAIVGAFGVVFLQHHLEQKRNNDAEKARRAKTLAMSVWTVEQLYDVTIGLITSNEKAFVASFADYAIEQFRDLRSAISVLPISELEEGHAIALMSARNTTNKLISVIHVARTQLHKNAAEDYLSQQLFNLSCLIERELNVLRAVPSDSHR